MILFYGVSIYLRVLIGKHEIFYGVSISPCNAVHFCDECFVLC